MHLGESANTGAQLPAKEDPKLSESQGAGQLSENWTLTEVLKKGLTRCISAKVQTRVHNLQPETTQKLSVSGAGRLSEVDVGGTSKKRQDCEADVASRRPLTVLWVGPESSRRGIDPGELNAE